LSNLRTRHRRDLRLRQPDSYPDELSTSFIIITESPILIDNELTPRPSTKELPLTSDTPSHRQELLDILCEGHSADGIDPYYHWNSPADTTLLQLWDNSPITRTLWNCTTSPLISQIPELNLAHEYHLLNQPSSEEPSRNPDSSELEPLNETVFRNYSQQLINHLPLEQAATVVGGTNFALATLRLRQTLASAVDRLPCLRQLSNHLVRPLPSILF
jgi:hypothetical protein